MDDIFSKNKPFIIENVFLNERNADIFIDGEGRIGSIGPGTAKKCSGDAAFSIDGKGALVLPGLVNTHTHAAMTLLRGYADDMPLQQWLTDKIWPLEANLTGKDVYAGTKLACLEMIRSGTTAFNDMYFFMEDAARAVDEMGIRATLAYGFIDLFNDDKREHEIKATEDMVKTIRSMNNPRIKPALGPHAIYTVSPEGLKWIAGISTEEKLPVHVHLSETEKEVDDAVSQWNKRPAEILDECGILGDRTIAAHCCWLSREECALLGKRGVHVSHNPVSNMKLAVNRAMPYHWLREEGVNVCLGTDGCASNNNLDLFEEMKVAALLQKFSWNSQTLLPAGEALHMATAAGAQALGLGTGSLSAGSPADLILVSRNSVCNTPFHNPVSNIVYSCNGSSVDTVVCNGRVLMHERVIPGEEKIIAEASGAAFDLVKRTTQ
jgi:5-methylthioadenosine/S-adenosylhomocysteine deaminase